LTTNSLFKTYISPLLTRDYWQMVADYVGLGRKKQTGAITDRDALAEFLGSRASHVAQTSLYGYLRTRAGTRFPEMFENPAILESINIAKWHIWLACVSDLCLFTGQCIHQSGKMEAHAIGQLMSAALHQLLEQTGTPDEAGADFAAAREKVVQRISQCDWTLQRDDETVFSQSPEALFYWSPIADDLKVRDETIVKNSIRFRWIEIRRSTRDRLDFEALARLAIRPT
jgi:hypothetical protein